MKCLNSMLLLCLLAAANIARAGTCTIITPAAFHPVRGDDQRAARCACRHGGIFRRGVSHRLPILPGVLIR